MTTIESVNEQHKQVRTTPDREAFLDSLSDRSGRGFGMRTKEHRCRDN